MLRMTLNGGNPGSSEKRVEDTNIVTPAAVLSLDPGSSLS